MNYGNPMRAHPMVGMAPRGMASGGVRSSAPMMPSKPMFNPQSGPKMDPRGQVAAAMAPPQRAVPVAPRGRVTY